MTEGVKVSGIGDAQKLRKALANAGYSNMNTDWAIFSDTRIHSRRLKVWFANYIFNSPQIQQQYLEQLLMEAFGKRYVGGFFTVSSAWRCNLNDPNNPPAKSFCVRLKK